jgi:cell division protein FtsL
MKMKKSLLLIGFLSCVVFVLAIARITIVNSISTTGIKLVDIQNKIEGYKKANELLKEQYLQTASYTTISEKAKQLGFVPVSSTAHVDLSAPLPLASR